MLSTPDPSLEPFLAPRGVAIVGASHDPTKLGYGLSRNLVQSGYRGAIHFVNIKGGSLMGRPGCPRPGGRPTRGAVAFTSPAGAICAAALDWAPVQGGGLSAMVSLGTQAGVNETDLLAP